MKYKYILFDLDGTLTDSKVGITKSIQYALEKYGIEDILLNELEKFIGPPLKESFIEFYSFDEMKAVQAIEFCREYFKEKGIFENEVYKGISELLFKLKQDGLVVAVATSKPTVFAEKILEHFGLTEYFDIIIGSNLDGTRTNKAEIIEYVLTKLGINTKEQVVMVGDRKHDVIGAQKNCVHSIGVSYGYGTIDELESVEPTYIVNSVEELYSLLATGDRLETSQILNAT